ncbi:tryptophanyl-tRNA synthetase [Truncatella angustata]|uniref:Tryptophan--tRNA ligase, mitochondrial n=1 Tax=Truncatella angustata TaxID=152316 RepID=A0A9P8V032_9PEZI|nr:tryptophanyl-tRNA synthetase [Truncatella angustata]KAH6661275.1 tryptophanyl-tRNA synthetase [Truncatella angustata]
MSLPKCVRCRPSTASRHLSVLLRDAAQGRSQRRFHSSTTSASTTTQGEPQFATIFSGIQPTGVPHLGNYLGAMRQWKRLQDAAGPEDQLYFSIVDLHAITMPQDAPLLRQRSREMLASLMAIGLDPKKCTMFYQSAVPAHAELMWILSCTASFGYLGRMTQWKSKLTMKDNRMSLDDETIGHNLKLGLFSYPVLQAADILIHRATHVPVGDDQRQHLEFARECATNFNATYPGGNLIAPETITTETPRVMSLQNPNNKMSKSAPNHRSRILITASPDEIRSRIKGAVTDSENIVSYNPVSRPGVANLLELWSQCDPEGRTPAALAADCENLGLGDLKKRVGDAIVKELEGVRVRYEEILDRSGGRWVEQIQLEGAQKARDNAAETMRMVRDVVGLAGM